MNLDWISWLEMEVLAYMDVEWGMWWICHQQRQQRETAEESSPFFSCFSLFSPPIVT